MNFVSYRDFSKFVVLFIVFLIKTLYKKTQLKTMKPKQINQTISAILKFLRFSGSYCFNDLNTVVSINCLSMGILSFCDGSLMQVNLIF